MDGRHRQRRAPERVPDQPGASDAAVRVLSLALSDAALDALPRNVLKPGARVNSVTLDALPGALLTGHMAPPLILSPLLTPRFDALDVAVILTRCGYRGRYLALVDKLPSASLIRREVAAQSPGINFDVIVLDGSTPLHPL